MSKIDDNDLRIAVMNAMWPLPCVNPGYTNRDELNHQKRRCTKWRDWAESAELDDRTRKAYLHWVEYCEYQNARGEQELILRTGEKRMAEYDAKRKAQSERVSQIQVVKPAVKF